MRLLEHYQLLYNILPGQEKAHSITIGMLAKSLSCTERNAKLIIHRMQQAGWIVWKPGKGRGNTSSIMLLADLEELILAEAKERSTVSMEEGIYFLHRFSISKHTQRLFVDWLFFASDGGHTKPPDTIDRLQFPSYRPLPKLDPMLVHRRSENHIMRHIFNRLIRYDEKAEKHVPELAHAWSHNHDYTVWIFQLRKRVRFHNEKELVAEDVCYSFLRHQKTCSAYHWILANLEKAEALHPYTVQFTFEKPMPHFLHLATSMGGSIVPSEDHSDAIPIGTGPFQVVENTLTQLRLKTFEHFFGTRPFLDEVNMYFFPELYDNQPSEVVESERVNFYQYPYTSKSTANFQQTTVLDQGSKLLSLNGNKGRLATDTMLRKAIFHLLQPEELIRQLQGNRYLPAGRLLRDTENDASLLRNPALVHELLNASSYQGETFHLYSYTGAGNELDGRWIQQQLSKAGVDVTLHFLPYEELMRQNLDAADMLLGEQLADESRLQTYLSCFQGTHSLPAHHIPDQNRKRIQRMVSDNLSEKEHIQRLQQEEAALCNNHHLLFLYRLEQFAIYPKNVENIQLNALGWVDYTKLWFNPLSVRKEIENE
ncbi:SgrR family transcriptional regulator [Sediminibacillus halophilus]|uniref:DNA-binding transcriptional regulator SgrR of sgrS sRNA, contains a MarR-type HTH domain and a solute-binding domain n=1 Tax=Sediminibacillus halophilus TaxID=482461 RepID=A0A1G9P020_9BACI|nr:SgrR family transcriptional regulator [Sediminibacillus halophilus]SDL92158.1 DNA-binding transcriptional regulator SgrR of sgrS sRNA, contains a MarR-type HTH domain and a solute-binding domain [Sediminibacillus halophilus]